MSLETLQKKIQKAVKGSHVSILSESNIAKHDNWINTPAYDLNRILSGDLFKGLPEKSLTYLVGPEASFKSSFSALCAANSQKEGFTPIVIDTEGAWTSDFVERWGLDPDNILYIYEPFVDAVCSILGQIIDDNDDSKKYCIIIDSIGGLEVQKLVDDSIKGDVKADQGQLQKKIKRALKLLLYIIKKKNSIGIYTGHQYGDPNAGMYSSGLQIGGGKFASLAPDIILQLKKSKKLDNEKNIVGTIIKAISLKNRFYPPFNKCEVDIDYINGINNLHGMVDLASEFNLIEKGGAGWYTNKETNEKIQGTNKVESWIDDNMLNIINEKIKNSGYNTIDDEMVEEFKHISEGIV